jgi:two-component sensor histidine kinase
METIGDPIGQVQPVPPSVDALQDALAQKTALIHEVDHRVNNNLQLIASLFQIQARRSDDPATKAVLHGMLSRINAIAIVHRRLFRGEDAKRFDVAAFLQDLAPEIAAAEGGDDVSLEMDLVRSNIATRKAAPLALILSELITNAFRHAFPNGQGHLHIETAATDGMARIKIVDDGVGIRTAELSEGFGFTIVELLCRQIGGRLERLAVEHGAGFEITLEAG